ncbi:MAG: hypothetical protein GTN80_10400 [Nitrososphaeria archaeon]|nr:hypothetical protein [Nitrososphaeria archaeon]NIN53749.1 hypothetical protein [Nitrososphaeria archaeon]NIQ34030.1 hypothetical protein [Nitrososphaeria archaeon]
MSEIDEKILKASTHTSSLFFVFLAILVAFTSFFLFSWYIQLTKGLVVTGMGDIGTSAPWGLYISNFIFLVGVASAGMIIGFLVHVGRVEMLRPIARIAELITCIALSLSILSVCFDLGRLERFLNLFTSGQLFSPFFWDLVVVSLYLILSSIMLYLPLREDMLIWKEMVPKWSWLYSILLGGYRSSEMKRRMLKRICWWLAIAILLVMVSVHSAIVPWIFGILSGRPGWYSYFYGAYFGVIHVATGVAVVIIASASIRYLFKLDNYIPLDTFKYLGNFLLGLIAIYLHFMFSEQVTVAYAGPNPESNISNAVLFGEFAWLYWPTVLIGLVLPCLILITPRTRTIPGIVTASIIATTAFFLKRIIVVVPSLTHPLLPYPVGVYTPTWIEWSLIGGSYTVGILAFTLFIKVFPIVEVTHME